MVYDLTSELDVKKLRTKLEYYIEHKKRISLTEERDVRSRRQNSYIHSIMTVVAKELGESAEMVKQVYWKHYACPAIFLRTKKDKRGKQIVFSRSSADLDTKEMTDAIEGFRDWASQELGIYLPEPHEEEMVREMERQLQYYK